MSWPICSFGSIQEPFDPAVLIRRVLWKTIVIVKMMGLYSEVFYYQFFSVTTLLSTFNKSNLNELSSLLDKPLVDTIGFNSF